MSKTAQEWIRELRSPPHERRDNDIADAIDGLAAKYERAVAHLQEWVLVQDGNFPTGHVLVCPCREFAIGAVPQVFCKLAAIIKEYEQHET